VADSNNDTADDGAGGGASKWRSLFSFLALEHELPFELEYTNITRKRQSDAHL